MCWIFIRYVINIVMILFEIYQLMCVMVSGVHMSLLYIIFHLWNFDVTMDPKRWNQKSYHTKEWLDSHQGSWPTRPRYKKLGHSADSGHFCERRCKYYLVNSYIWWYERHDSLACQRKRMFLCKSSIYGSNQEAGPFKKYWHFILKFPARQYMVEHLEVESNK